MNNLINTPINTLKTSPAGPVAFSSAGAGDSSNDLAAQHSYAPLVLARNPSDQAAEPTRAFRRLHALAKSQPLRVAIKVRGRILFINLNDVIAVQARGKHVLLQRSTSSYLLRESISAVAASLEPRGFIRIHRSVLVNAAFVAEIRPLSTGEYCLRVEDGKEYTVTRTYKKNLKSLAEFWIGTSASFSD